MDRSPSIGFLRIEYLQKVFYGIKTFNKSSMTRKSLRPLKGPLPTKGSSMDRKPFTPFTFKGLLWAKYL